MIISIDVEADGPYPGGYSMIQLGAVVVEESLDRIFYGELRPISEFWKSESLAVTKLTREQTMEFPHPAETIFKFKLWLDDLKKLAKRKRLIFASDNNGFDWQFVNYYLWQYCGENPFGWSSTNIGSFYKGLKQDLFSSFKKLRKTKHTHNPVDDAMGNAEALLEMLKIYEVKGWK